MNRGGFFGGALFHIIHYTGTPNIQHWVAIERKAARPVHSIPTYLYRVQCLQYNMMSGVEIYTGSFFSPISHPLFAVVDCYTVHCFTRTHRPSPSLLVSLSLCQKTLCLAYQDKKRFVFGARRDFMRPPSPNGDSGGKVPTDRSPPHLSLTHTSRPTDP